MDTQTGYIENSADKEHLVKETGQVPSPLPTAASRPRLELALDPVIALFLALIAFLPRLLLAVRLDVVTDEIIYILGGKTYFPLLTHLSIGSSGWSYNYEHPPFVKLLIGLALSLNSLLSQPLAELLAARLPSVLAGTLLIVAFYLLARAPFGRVVALLAALCLALSPWLVYFSALAYLDMTMTTLITIAYLLLWHALRRPQLFLLVGILLGLAVDSKYTAALAVPGMLLFCGYYYLLLRPRLPIEQRQPLPWRCWIGAVVLAPLTFLIADPAIWPNPVMRLLHSFLFEWHHSSGGHLTFLDGAYSLHVPHWAILYIIFTKMSLFVTIPAAGFALFALVQLVRFHLGQARIDPAEATRLAFSTLWLLALLATFSLLNIVVGTHYHLPIAPPVALAGACGLATLLRYRRGQLLRRAAPTNEALQTAARDHERPGLNAGRPGFRLNIRASLIVTLLAIALIVPHLVGLTSVYGAEGYTSELFHGEDGALQVAYPGYREAVQWLAAHTHGSAHIGFGAVLGTLDASGGYAEVVGTAAAKGVSASWYSYNSDLPARLTISEVHPNDHQFSVDYLVWPMHLVQRGYPLPDLWRSHIVHIVSGGDTTYCYIMARDPATIS